MVESEGGKVGSLSWKWNRDCVWAAEPTAGFGVGHTWPPEPKVS